MSCNIIGYYGACLDGLTLNDILFVGMAFISTIFVIRILLKKFRSGDGGERG